MNDTTPPDGNQTDPNEDLKVHVYTAIIIAAGYGTAEMALILGLLKMNPGPDEHGRYMVSSSHIQTAKACRADSTTSRNPLASCQDWTKRTIAKCQAVADRTGYVMFKYSAGSKDMSGRKKLSNYNLTTLIKAIDWTLDQLKDNPLLSDPKKRKAVIKRTVERALPIIQTGKPRSKAAPRLRPERNYGRINSLGINSQAEVLIHVYETQGFEAMQRQWETNDKKLREKVAFFLNRLSKLA